MRWWIWVMVVFASCSGQGRVGKDEWDASDVEDTPQWEDVAGPDGAGSADAKDTSGSGDRPDDNTPGGAIEWLREEWCGPYAEAVCGAAGVCGCGEVPGFPSDSCESVAREFCVTRVESLADAFASGHLVLKPEALPDCLAALGTALSHCTLPHVFQFSVDCVLFVAPAGLGEPCGDGLCADGLGTCAPPGVCVRLPGPGEGCSGSLCGPGLACDEGVCIEPRGAGSACERDRQCAVGLVCRDGSCQVFEAPHADIVCMGPTECGEHLVCLATTRRACAPKSGSGEACEGDDECVDGTYCDGGWCQATPQRGEFCGAGVVCGTGLGCDFETGRCESLPGRGEPCALGRYGPVLCAEGLMCVEGQCSDPPSVGQPCGQGPDGMPACAEGLGCDFRGDGTSVCAPRRGPGDACSNDTMCRDELYCDFSMLLCSPGKLRGEPCPDGNECAAGLTCMIPRPGKAPSCEPLPGLSETCLFDCAEGLVCRPVADHGLCGPSVCMAIPF